MVDYKQILQRIIDSVINFSFEFDIETLKKEMELQEVSKDELKRLGENKVKENFNNGIFKIKMPNGNLIDSNSIYEYCKNNNINEPILFLNSNFKYVKWNVKKDFVTPQIKKHIKNQLNNNTDINLQEVKKILILEDIKNKKADAYIDNLPIKTTDYISKGKFQIHSSCSHENALKIINEVIEELEVEKRIYVKDKIKQDCKNIFFYIIFISLISLLWFINRQKIPFKSWITDTINFILFFIPLVIMRLINHSFFDSLLFKKKAIKKYEKEFSSRNI